MIAYDPMWRVTDNMVFILLPRLSLYQTCSEERRYLFVKSTDPWSRVIKLFHTQSCLRAGIITPHILLGLFTTKHSQFIMLTHYSTYLTLRFRVGINVVLSHSSVHGLKWVSAHRNLAFPKIVWIPRLSYVSEYALDEKIS